MELGLMVMLGSGYTEPKLRLRQISIGSVHIWSVSVSVQLSISGSANEPYASMIALEHSIARNEVFAFFSLFGLIVCKIIFQNIIGDSNRLYNPDPIDFVVIPHEEIGQSTAIDACAVAEDVLLKVKEFIDQREWRNLIGYLAS